MRCSWFFCLILLTIGLWPGFYSNSFTVVTNYLIKNSILGRQDVNKLYSYTTQFMDIFPKIEPWRVLLVTCILSFFSHHLYLKLFHHRIPLKQRIVQTFFSVLRNAPIVRGRVDSEIKKTSETVNTSLAVKTTLQKRRVLGEKGIGKEELLSECDGHASMGGWDWEKGNVSGAVYIHDKEHKEVMQKVYAMFYETNPLHPDVFPGVRKMETEIVSMCLDLFHGDNGGCGVTTSGGTSSILMAMKAYRDIGHSKGIAFPEIILSYSTHPAFMKAAEYFGMRTVRFKVRKDFKANVSAYERAINSNTVVVVASAPGYPNGIIDPVSEIAGLGEKHGIGVHVDCCLGSLLVPFMESAGYSIPVVDFRLPGVSSISCDTHKYGNGPKGCSVLMYRSGCLRQRQFFADSEFMGGIYLSAGIPGSRNGSILASTWATLLYTGREGYVARTRDIVGIREEVEAEVRKIRELVVFGEPQLCVLSFGSDTLDIYLVSDQMANRGWHVNNNQFPAGIHMAFTSVHIGKNVPGRFVADLKESLAAVSAGGLSLNEAGTANVYGVSTKIPDRGLIGKLGMKYIEGLLDT